MNYWNRKDVPHKGWQNIGYEDLEEATHVCDMCGKEEIRYVHTMYHSLMEDYFNVGCICAEKMTNDYKTPKDQIKKMKKKNTWMTVNWKKENYYEYEYKSFNGKYGRTTVEIFKCNEGYVFCLDGYLRAGINFATKKELKETLYNDFVSI